MDGMFWKERCHFVSGEMGRWGVVAAGTGSEVAPDGLAVWEVHPGRRHPADLPLRLCRGGGWLGGGD